MYDLTRAIGTVVRIPTEHYGEVECLTLADVCHILAHMMTDGQPEVGVMLAKGLECAERDLAATGDRKHDNARMELRLAAKSLRNLLGALV